VTIVSIEIDKPADAIIIAAPYAPSGPIIVGTSNSLVDVASGVEVTFHMNEAGLGFMVGTRIRAAYVDDPVATWMEGVCTAFDGANLTVLTSLSSGFGLHSNWNITVAGQPGQGLPGPPGPVGPQGPPGPSGSGDEAPIDDNAYGRSNAAWLRVLKYSGDVVDGGNF
jgi:hypothetical protein